MSRNSIVTRSAVPHEDSLPIAAYPENGSGSIDSEAPGFAFNADAGTERPNGQGDPPRSVRGPADASEDGSVGEYPASWDQPNGAESVALLDTKHCLTHTHPHDDPSELSHESHLSTLGRLKMEQGHIAEWGGPQDGLWVWRLRRGKDGKPDKTVPDTARSWSAVSDSMKACGGWLRFRHVLSGSHAGEHRLHKAYFCNRRGLCVFCDHRRSVRVCRRFAPRVLTLLREQPTLRALFVTTTIKNGPDLGERFDAIAGAMSRWNQRRTNALTGGRHKTELTKFVAGAGSFEVKRGKGGQWHPHYHGVWLYEGRADFKTLDQEYNHHANGEGHGLFKHLKSQMALDYGRIDRAEFEKSFPLDLREVFKYAVKPGRDVSRSDRWRAYLTLYNKNMVRSFGKLGDVELPDDLVDDPLDWETLSYEEMIYYYNGGKYERGGAPVVHGMAGVDREPQRGDSYEPETHEAEPERMKQVEFL